MKRLKLKVDLEKGDFPVVGDINDALGKVGLSGVNNAGYSPQQRLGAAEAARISVANALPGMLQAGAQSYANPYATDRSTAVSVGRAFADSAPSLGASIGTAVLPGVGTAVGFGVGLAVQTGINYFANESDATGGAAEQEFGAVLGSLGAAGVDASRADLQGDLQRMARMVGARKAREHSNRKLLNQFSNALNVGSDSQGIWNG